MLSHAARNANRRLLRMALPLLACVLFVTGHPPAALAQDDYHARFEAQCGRCHGHSGPFARASLEIVDGTLTGRAVGLPVEVFLQRHPGGLSSTEIESFRDVLLRQVQAGGLFNDRCAICHGRAVELAATHLALFDDALVIRYSGEPVRELLTHHGRLSRDEIEIVYRALRDITTTR